MQVNLQEVWRDKELLSEIKNEILRQKQNGWYPWEILLPPDLIYPMLEEVSSGMYTTWSPVVLDTGVQVGNVGEVSIRFVRKEEKLSPVMVKVLEYRSEKADNVTPVEVSNGNKIRV